MKSGAEVFCFGKKHLGLIMMVCQSISKQEKLFWLGIVIRGRKLMMSSDMGGGGLGVRVPARTLHRPE